MTLVVEPMPFSTTHPLAFPDSENSLSVKPASNRLLGTPRPTLIFGYDLRRSGSRSTTLQVFLPPVKFNSNLSLCLVAVRAREQERHRTELSKDRLPSCLWSDLNNPLTTLLTGGSLTDFKCLGIHTPRGWSFERVGGFQGDRDG